MSDASIPQAAGANLSVQAAAYAQRGWHVLPLHTIRDGHCSCGRADCASPGKHPRTPNGVKDATNTPDVIAAWWQRWPDANVGIATGAASGLFVLDVDGEAGEESLHDLERVHGRLPATVESLTGGGGRHVFFAHPGQPVRNKVALAMGLDIRADGGYIVAPPSLHVSGRRYEWELSSLPEEVPLAEAPPWLLALVASGNGDGNGAGHSLSPLEPIPQGQRNATLTSLAGSMRRRGARPESIEAALLAENARCQPPLAADEVRRIAASVGKYEPASEGYSYNLTDLGNAKRFVALCGEDMRYCAPWGKWLIWDGVRWREDTTESVMRLAEAVVADLYGEAAAISSTAASGSTKDERDRLGKKAEAILAWAAKTEARMRLDALVALAKHQEPVVVLPEELDRDEWLLNVSNGVIDLRTGELRPHQREDLITKLAPVDYNPEADCPRWQQFLAEITDGNQHLLDFLQRAVGYSLTGSTREQVLFIPYGCGANGKSTFLTTLQAMLGDYAGQAAPNLLLATQSDRHPTELADLYGRRFVVATETESGGRLAESLVKQLTGCDRLKVRRMRENFWEFTATHKLWLATNHKPRVRGTDLAIWRRIKLIPFTVTFYETAEAAPPGKAHLLQDKNLQSKLFAELPGILRWCVEGCLAWQRSGLDVPAEVREATATYRDEQDILAGFLADCCLLDPRAKTSAKELYRAYEEWCKANGERPQSQRNFGMQLTERGFDRYRGGKSGGYVWRGLQLTEPTEPTEPEFRLNALYSPSYSAYTENRFSSFSKFSNQTGSNGTATPEPPSFDLVADELVREANERIAAIWPDADAPPIDLAPYDADIAAAYKSRDSHKLQAALARREAYVKRQLQERR